MIREEVKLVNPNNSIQTMTGSGSCDVPPTSGYSSFYFTMGGRVVVRAGFPGTLNLGQTVTFTSSLGTVFSGSVSDFFGHSFNVGTVSAGDRISFSMEFQDPYVSTIKGQQPDANGWYGTLGAKANGGGYIWHGFDTRYADPGYTYSLSVLFYANPSSAKDLRSPSGPPREPCPIIAPANGDVVAQYIPNGYSGDAPFYRSKNDSLAVTSDLLGLTLNLGSVQAGDTLQFSLTSGSPDLFGQRTYPRSQANPWVWTVPFWYMEYEDWIDNDFLDYFTYAWVVPTKYLVSFDRATVSRGDTVRMFIDPIGFSENPSQPMDLNITQGRGIAVLQDTMGTFLGTDIWGRPFSQVSKELRLVISPSAPSPVMTAVANGSALAQTQTIEPSRIFVQVFDDWDNAKTGRGVLQLGQNEASILLGETKYYYATDENGELAIHETTDPIKLPSGGLADATFDDPAAAANSEKNPVYWEDQYPTYSGTTFTGSNTLPHGMIRLVGRYWENGKTFKTTLTAHATDGTSTSTDIEVKKPSKLSVTPVEALTDVFGKAQNLDSLLMFYAGKYGIPPQVLKADIDQESSFKLGYRWEPFVDVTIQHSELQYMDDDFRYKKTVNPNSEGNPGVPTNHSNVFPIAYPRNDFSTIWDRMFSQSMTLNPSASTNRYPIALWFSDPAQEWQGKHDDEYTELTRDGTDAAQAEQEAIDYANEFLRNEWFGGLMSAGIAQTRSAASYGLMQLLYTSAVEFRDYPFDRTEGDGNHLPEYINIADSNLTYAVPFLLSKINAELKEEGDGTGKPDQWTLGFEKTLIVALNMYNGVVRLEPTVKHPNTRYNWHYGFDVLDKTGIYLPSN